MGKLGFFTDKEFYRKLLKLGLPIALQQLLYSVFGVVDTAMIAQLGADSTAGVGAASSWYFYLIVISLGLIAATSSLVAQYWGIKDFFNIRRTTGFSLVIAMSFALLFTVVVQIIPELMIKAFTSDAAMISEGTKYLKVLSLGFVLWTFNFVFSTALKSTECVRIPLFSSMASIVANVFLNWVFIFGNLGAPEMGVEGAALGTIISFALNTVIMLAAVKITKHRIVKNLKHYFAWTKDFLKKFTKIMTPAVVNEIIWVSGYLMYSVVLGRYGNVNFGSFTIYRQVESMFFTFFIGLSSACSILIGKELGRGEVEKGWNYSVKNLVLAPILAVILGIIMVLTRYPVLNLMRIPDPEMIAMSAKLLVFYAIASPIRVIPFMTIVGIFRSGGDTKTGLLVDTLNVWFVGVPMTFIAGFVLKAPFEWVFLAMFTEDIFKSIFCIVIFIRKKWLNQLTHDSEVFTKGLKQVD